MSHYFSHVRLLAGLHESAWLRDLARHGEAYRDHALIWRLFPGDAVRRDFVFRRLEDECSFYVVSARPPQDEAGLFHIQKKPYAPELKAGEQVRFDLRANPVVSRRTEGTRSQRHDVLMDAKREANTTDALDLKAVLDEAGRNWLVNRADQWGLAVAGKSILQSAYSQHTLKTKGRNIRYSSLDYQGIAQVTDPDRLKAALFDGVGHSKGFGCGLLLVRRMD